MEEYSDSTTLAEFCRAKRRKKSVKKNKKDDESIQRTEKTNVLGVVVHDMETAEFLPALSVEQCAKKTNVFEFVEHDVKKGGPFPGPSVEEPCSGDHGAEEIEVSLFDNSVENHFKTMEKICQLCGEKKELDDSNGIELERLSSSIMFLSEWKQFTYHTKTIQFACQGDSIPPGKDSVGSVELPQFSASAVPKGKQKESSMPSDYSSKDFVMYVGGLVWALDWCPRFPQDSGNNITCEFLSIAAHPPDASYHKIGSPLSGRGLIQIWCMVHETFEKNESLPKKKKTYQSDKPRGRPRKDTSTDNPPQPKRPIGRPRKVISMDNPSKPKKPKGRPRKFPLKEPSNYSTCDNDSALALCPPLPDNPLNLLPDDGASGDIECVPESSKTKQKCLNPTISSGTVRAASTRKRKKLYVIVESDNDSDIDPPLMQNENQQPKLIDVMPHTNKQEHVCSGESISNGGSLQSQSKGGITKDIALPRVVLCLAHNGKVAWDVKWRPVIEENVKHRLGYLAVLLGNGALEVWDVPHPYAMKSIYSSCQKEGTDPRFFKLDPVFRCSTIKTGDRQSIPLTVEWSSSFPHDLIVAGCHDGVVALWKFSADKSSKDIRPLLCFSADTVPIRTLAWAPSESGSESSNVIVTAGHKGMKFWDLRDPFRPLWDFNPAQKNIYSLDWLSDPRCVVVAYDDGTLRILSLSKAAIDFPVTGKPFTGTPQQGFTSYYCLSFPIWDVQCSRSSGIIAYCGADGNVLHFQLTNKAVNKDPHRNRAPHFLCGSIKEEEGPILTVVTPRDNTPFPMKKSLNKWSNVPCTIKGFTFEANRANREKASQTFKNNILAMHNKSDPADKLVGMDGPSSERRSKYKPWGGKGKKKGEELSVVDFSSSSKRREEEEDDGDNDGGGYSNAEKNKDGENDNKKGEKEDEEEKEVFPSKSVAIHRVRWNQNKGSERWLSYGGAAGIVRLQEVDLL